MALTPYLFDHVIDDVFRPFYANPFVQFGMIEDGLEPQFDSSLKDVMSVPLRSGYVRPWRYLSVQNSGRSNVTNDKDGFKINLDVQQFKPEELSVKVVDNHIVVDGKHEERSDDHGFVSRQFTRRYHLPDNVDHKAIASTLSSDGVLQLSAPKVPVQEGPSHIIPIKQSSKPAAVKDKPSGETTTKKVNKMET